MPPAQRKSAVLDACRWGTHRGDVGRVEELGEDKDLRVLQGLVDHRRRVPPGGALGQDDVSLQRGPRCEGHRAASFSGRRASKAALSTKTSLSEASGGILHF